MNAVKQIFILHECGTVCVYIMGDLGQKFVIRSNVLKIHKSQSGFTFVKSSGSIFISHSNINLYKGYENLEKECLDLNVKLNFRPAIGLWLNMIKPVKFLKLLFHNK